MSANEFPIFLRRLVEEHRRFLAAFDRLRQDSRSAASATELGEQVFALRSLCRVYLEEFHHRKEEDLLFPLLARDPRIHAGGPECVLHFDTQMRSPPLQLARAACTAAGVPAVEVPDSARVQGLRDEHSPLLIPWEDHEAGRILLRGIDVLPPGDIAAALGLLDIYRDLQVSDFRKEDGCLFCMSRQLISPQTWAGLEQSEPTWTAEGLHPLAVLALSAVS